MFNFKYKDLKQHTDNSSSLPFDNTQMFFESVLPLNQVECVLNAPCE